MPPRKVPRTILSPEVKEEQLILPQQGKRGLPPPQRSPKYIVVDVPGSPPVGPLEIVTQRKPEMGAPVIRVKIHALTKMAPTSDSSLDTSTRDFSALVLPPNCSCGRRTNPPSNPPPRAPCEDRCSPTSHDAHYAGERLKGSPHPHHTWYP
ncbi:hypothetical protein ACLOJK_006616 [Asimina triloba]